MTLKTKAQINEAIAELMAEPTPEDERKGEDRRDYDDFDNFEIDREQNRYERHLWGD